MNIDFHYGVIYIVARHAGLAPAAAEVVAHACQYVDDATTPGLLRFSGGESFERFASAHKMLDFHNADNNTNRWVWVPFHFLPGAQGTNLDQKSVCRKNSDVAKQMVRRALAHPDADNALHRLGITLHVYVDTWAHQGFSGTESQYNKVTSLVGDQHDHLTWLRKLGAALGVLEDNAEAEILDRISELGHGAALHFPDMPWANWEYHNAHGDHVHRVNLPDFVEAADMACRVVQAFIARSTDFENRPGLGASVKADLEHLMGNNQDHNEGHRFTTLCEKVANGAVTSLREVVPTYIAKGPGSWKHLATGIPDDDDGDDRPDWTPVFETSHYRKFHDAVKEHRFVVTQEILPANGVRLV